MTPKVLIRRKIKQQTNEPIDVAEENLIMILLCEMLSCKL